MPDTVPDYSDVPPTGAPAPKRNGGAMLARAVPSIVAALVVAVLGGGVAFYVRASIVEEEVSDLEVAVADHDAQGHRSAARELSDLRTDIARLVEKVSASDRADVARQVDMERRLDRIEQAIERR